MTRDRGHLLTEQRHPASMDLDRMSVAEGFDLMNAEDATIAQAVTGARDEIIAAIEKVVAAFRAGGRLIYVGAGTSGRLGVVDASECPPTFLVEPDMVQGVIAGGPQAMFRSQEFAEDRPQGGAKEIVDRNVGSNDVVFGIATGGTTPYVHGALEEAHRRGAATVFFACVPRAQCPDDADVSIRVLTGPEVLTGSTRLKAGLATKMVLNMITTLSMVQIGKVYENLMVDVNAMACSKLIDRAVRIVMMITDLPREDAITLLDQAGGSVKIALIMHFRKIDRTKADKLLQEHTGHVREVLVQGEYH